MATPLNPTGSPVRVGTVRLRTPGLEGVAEAHAPGATGTRAAEQTTDALEAALAAEHVQPQESIEIVGTREVGVGGAGTRTTVFGEPALVAEVPDAGPDWGQFVLYTDEAGVTTWNFARTDDDAVDTTRGAAHRTYVIRRYVAPPPADPGTRGLVGAIGKKLLKVLAFPLIDPLVGVVGDYFAGRWEAKKRPYRFRTFTPDDYRDPDGSPLTAVDWDRLASGRALLMVHGTLSRAHTAFGGMDPATVGALHQKYEGRVFAFDHHTLSHTPRENVEWFFTNLPPGLDLNVDIVCHSRGGLVTRLLGEQQQAFSLGGRHFHVNRAVFVAVPNAGTILTDAPYMGDFIDTYTTLLNFFPSNGVTDVLEGIITVAKQLAVGALKGLDGLQAMLPTGAFLTALNAGDRDDKRYYALAANYEPADPGLKAFAVNRLLDQIFRIDNDLVVPTAGVYDQNGSGFFPIDDRHVYGPADGISHTTFFSAPDVQQRIRQWLS